MSPGGSWGAESSQERLLTQPFQLWVSVPLRGDGKSAATRRQSMVGGGALPNVGVCGLATNPWHRKKGMCRVFQERFVEQLGGGVSDGGCRHLRSCSICSMCRRAKLPLARMLWQLQCCPMPGSLLGPALPASGSSLILPEPLSAFSPSFSLDHPTNHPQNNGTITLRESSSQTHVYRHCSNSIKYP